MRRGKPKEKVKAKLAGGTEAVACGTGCTVAELLGTNRVGSY